MVCSSIIDTAAANCFVLLVHTTLGMSNLDWVVLLVTLFGIIAYGIYKSRNLQGSASYLMADKNMPWYIVLLGIMATQASAITFLSAPGQAYTDGMRFVQYYFGLPIAMIVISVSFIPIFRKLNVYTAYEYLETRFDQRTRVLTSILFLFSRGLSTGISIYAPSIILSSILGWNIYLTNVLMGGLLLVYTYSGGAKAVAHTQKLQFLIILGSMALAGFLVIERLPEGLTFNDALYVAGKSGKLNVITTDFSWDDKYNLWSGIIGGFFLALSYFGTDQSQVGRYITGKNLKQSRMGLLMNGMVKIPMQFSILLIGAMLFAFYSFQTAPIYFNQQAYTTFQEKDPAAVERIESEYSVLQQKFQEQAVSIATNREDNDALVADFKNTQKQIAVLRDTVRENINRAAPASDNGDTNYIFLYFVKHSLPKGLIGLLFAVIFLASWGSISAALNSLAASSMMDIQLLNNKRELTDKEQVRYGRLHTLFWGIFSIIVAMFATQMGSLIEAVNVLGSLFYGTILGIFLVAFYLKKIQGRAVFYAAIVTEVLVCIIYYLDFVSFLWLNVIGAALVVLIALMIPKKVES